LWLRGRGKGGGGGGGGGRGEEGGRGEGGSWMRGEGAAKTARAQRAREARAQRTTRFDNVHPLRDRQLVRLFEVRRVRGNELCRGDVAQPANVNVHPRRLEDVGTRHNSAKRGALGAVGED
jgi:hypothetical protein